MRASEDWRFLLGAERKGRSRLWQGRKPILVKFAAGAIGLELSKGRDFPPLLDFREDIGN